MADFKTLVSSELLIDDHQFTRSLDGFERVLHAELSQLSKYMARQLREEALEEYFRRKNG